VRRVGAWSGRSVWLALVAGLLVSLAIPAGAAAVRVVYVTNANSRDISALTINADGTLTPVSGSPYATGSVAGELDGVAVTPNAGHVYAAMAFDNTVYGWNIGADGGLTSAPSSPYATGAPNPLDVSPRPDGSRLYVNNHTAPQNQQLGVWAIAANGSLSQISGSPFTGKNTNAFPMILAPNGNFLYSPDENGVDGNQVTVYSLAASGAPSLLQDIASGTNPFGGGITPDNRFLYVSNPEDNTQRGSISEYSVGADGKLTSIGNVLTEPGCTTPCGHPLNIAITPDSSHLFVALRLSGAVDAFTINANGTLSLVPGAPFATGLTNPRSVALTPDGKRLYVSGEGTSNITGFNVASNGSLTTIPGSPFASGGTRPNLESIAITPNQPPTASFTATSATQGQASSFNGSASSDSDGTVTTYDWDFGDGTSLANGGPTPSHVYTQPGTYLASVRVTDNEGCSTERIFTGKATLCNGSAVAETSQTVTVPAATPTPPSPTPPAPQPPLPVLPPDLVAPVLQDVSVDPTRFGVDRRGPSEASAAALAKGTTIRYTLSEAARVVFTVDSRTVGRNVNGTCRRKTRRNRKRRKCTLMVRQGSFAKDSGQGANIKRFSGKIGRTTLRPGNYQLTLDATDAAGNRAQPVMRVFTILRR
jgi:6-phosphogluconolactonase (cycloisomerase 2 family)